MIGKAITMFSNFDFDFNLTIGSTTYNFNKNSTSSAVGNAYTYVRDDAGWYLIVYSSGTLNFKKLSHLIDFSLCGGGGGGGGSSQKYGYNGGGGGGGEIIDSDNYASQPTWVNGVKLAVNTDYSIVIGSGGSGGGRSGSGWGGYGSNGNPSSFNSVSAAGGIRGDGANDHSSGGWGTSRSWAYVFRDSSRILTPVSGYNTGYRGGGGKAGYDASGGGGQPGLFVIRSRVK